MKVWIVMTQEQYDPVAYVVGGYSSLEDAKVASIELRQQEQAQLEASEHYIQGQKIVFGTAIVEVDLDNPPVLRENSLPTLWLHD